MRKFSIISAVATVAIALAAAGASTAVLAKEWYVQAGSTAPWNGTTSQPFNSLAQVEAASAPGDEIFVLPSSDTLDGGIQLKDDQKLIGLGPKVTKAPLPADHAKITNTGSGHLDGDAIRLANNNTVKNIHIQGAYRAGILGINVTSPTIKDNLITENMNQHDIQTLQEDFVIFELQRNHYAGITLFACGKPKGLSHCQQQDPSAKWIANTGEVVIKGNEVRDSNVEGIVLLNDTGVIATYEVEDNYVHNLSLGFDGFNRNDLLPPLVPEVVRSRGFTMISGNGSQVTLKMKDFHATRLAPSGDFASDGVVLVAFGEDALVTADISDVVVSNPDGTGEAVNGDSLEFTHFGNNNTIDVKVKNATLSDSVSTLIKLLEVGPVNGNSTKFEIADSLLTNVNERVFEPGVGRGAITYIKIPAPGADTVDTIDLTVRNTVMSGHIRGIHIMNINGYSADNVNVLVENSSFRNMRGYTDGSEGGEGFRILNIDPDGPRIPPGPGSFGAANIDLGGGLLGSVGHNSFTNNERHDVAVVNLNFAGPSVDVFASDNYWGVGGTDRGPAPAQFDDYLLVGNATFTADSWLTTDPN